MQLRYNLDADTGMPHIAQHGVGERDVEDVLSRPLENLPGQRGSRMMIGKTRTGRLLKVIIVPDADGRSAFVVTAFDLIGKPLHAHRRRMRRRGSR